jgi:hypothetical protein
VVAHGADFGIAHDRGADRCLAVDNLGRGLDGDEIMAILATVLLQSSASGDGILTGLHLAAAVVRSGQPLAELASAAELAPAECIAP